MSEKRDQIFVIISSIKLRRFWWNLIVVSRINLLQNHITISHLTWIISLHLIVKFKMLIAHMLPLSCWRKKLQKLSHLNCGPVASKFARVEFTWQRAREDVQNTHHWCGPTDDDTDEWLLQWRRDPAWPVLFSVAVLVPPESLSDACFVYFLLQYFLHAVINWIQIWWIWKPQLLTWDKFWSFFL